MGNYLNLEEAAERLGVEYKTVYRLVRQGEIPAGKIGRIYRIREEDLEAYFEKQKAALASSARTGLTALEGRRCCACGQPILSELSVGGVCKETGKEICLPCWSIRKRRTCVPDAEPKAAPPRLEEGTTPGASRDLAKVIQGLKAAGKPVVTAAEARLAEESFLRSFGQRLEHVEELPDPLSRWTIVLRQARVKHEVEAPLGELVDSAGNRASRFVLKAGGWGKPKACLTLEARFTARPAVLREQGYDAEPLGEAELLPLLHEAADRAKAAGCFHAVLLASPTGWTGPAVKAVAEPSSSRGFRDRRVAAALVDLHADQVFLAEADERARGFLPLLAPARFAAEVARCAEVVRQALAQKGSLSLAEAAKACGVDPAWARAAFEELERQGGFAVDDLPRLGLVISRATV